MTIYRLWKGKQYPAQLEGGCFILGDPALGKIKHKTENAVRVRTETEAVDYIKKGFSLRVEPERGTWGTLVRKNLHIDGLRLT